jgi:L-threonylcarbamoyladenylate synthase
MRLSLLEAVQQLLTQEVIGIPTETVYGLAASLNSPFAIEKIFKLKNRPLINPLIVHVATLEEIFLYTQNHPPLFRELADAFWPGPLTCILPAKGDKVPALARANLSTVGIRIPEPDLTRQLIKLTGALVMPSANLSGRPSSTLASHVEEDFGASFPVLDGGACVKGVESTILLYQNEKWVIGRLGALAPEAFEVVLGYCPEIIQKKEQVQPVCPGQLFRHYAPNATLFLGNQEQVNQVSVIIGFNERSYPSSHRLITLGSIYQPTEVAEHLYQVLRQLDQEGIEAAWVDMDFPRQGLWLTIAERLKRAGEKS